MQRIVNISAVMRPTDRVAKQMRLACTMGRSLEDMLEDVSTIDTLAGLVEREIAGRTVDGRVDMPNVAAALIFAIMPPKSAALAERVVNTTATYALAGLLTEAIEKQQARGTGALDYRDVAAHVIGTLRRHQR